MPQRRSRLMFDREDYELLRLINSFLSGQKSYRPVRKLFDQYLHPRGIKELAAPRSLRLACAVFDLLHTLEGGDPAERIRALRAVRDEVLHNGSPTLRINTARVLLATMKEFVRAHGHTRRQLELAHDFKGATSGKPRLVRRLLREHHLLEMSEEWNQIAFDHHVHDANSKGRKTPTHLIMDAWLKGIRHLRVIYYNLVTPEAAAELLEAAAIMQVEVRIGVELSATYRGRYAHLIWAPRGFHTWQDFVAFLAEPGVRELMQQGAEVAAHNRRHVLRLLAAFNARHLETINESFGLSVPPLVEAEFLESVGKGQCSRLHLAEFAHACIMPHLTRRAAELRREHAAGDAAVKERAAGLIDTMNRLVPETIAEQYLRPEANPELRDPHLVATGPDVPELLTLDVGGLVDRIGRVHRGSRITLNASGLTAEDVLEILYLAGGRVTGLEIFNLKDWAEGKTEHRPQICLVRQVLNSGNVIEAKRLVREMLQRAERRRPASPDEDRTPALRQILRDLPSLLDAYHNRPLRSRLGSDSSGRSRHSQGMGLVVVPTLTARAWREVHRHRSRLLPVRTVAWRQVTHRPRRSTSPTLDGLFRVMRRLPFSWLSSPAYAHAEEWLPDDASTTLAPDGNIAALGGLPEAQDNQLTLAAPPLRHAHGRFSLSYLDTRLKNGLKVLVGFLPAFCTFFLTKDWRLLAWFGAPIWFAITGFRNVAQSVIGGGGLRRSPLLKWNDLISWSRVADSLLYTGFSVPLLDYLVKTVLLARGLGITTETGPVLLYSAMALANGVYISSHNAFRGLPRTAVVGNLFRALLSIPLAVGLNALILRIAIRAGVAPAAAAAGLQLWAAVISKLCSDGVAAVIEGLADRAVNLGRRMIDYRDKQQQILGVFSRLEVLLPEADVLAQLARPKQLVHAVRAAGGGEIVREMIVNALDLMYFWLLQPRGRTAFTRLVRESSRAEGEILLRSQLILERKKQISTMLVDGLVGRQFDQALAFYLSRVEGYLADLRQLGGEQLTWGAAMRRVRDDADEDGRDTSGPVAPPAPPPAAEAATHPDDGPKAAGGHG